MHNILVDYIFLCFFTVHGIFFYHFFPSVEWTSNILKMRRINAIHYEVIYEISISFSYTTIIIAGISYERMSLDFTV